MPQTVKPPLYRDVVERAIREHHKLPLRSEAQHSYEDFFVDANQLESLDTPDWQVVFGRRGTGKTFLLKLLQEHCMERVEHDRTVAVYVSAQDTKVSPHGKNASDRVRAIGFFQTFLELLTDRLTNYVETLLGKPRFLEALSGSKKRAVERADDLLLELLDLAQVGAPVRAFDDLSFTETSSQSESHHSKLGAKAELGASLSGVPGSLKAVADVGRQREATTGRTVESTGTAAPRYSLVRERLLRLMDLLRIERIIVLLDEWSVLDPSATTAIQPEFAELLKRAFFGTPKISVKVATNRYQTRFSNRGAGTTYRGLELTADLFEATNLDRALLGQHELAAFYEQLLFKRLAYLESDIRKFDPSGTGEPDEQFILSIFKSRATFLELVKGAEGVPRDFLVAFNGLAQQNKHSVATGWPTIQVRQVLADKGVEGQREIEYQSEASQLLSPCIKDVVVATGTRLFLARRDDAMEVSSAIDELLEKRLIHEYPSRDFPVELREDYRAYLLDYGLWLDWERAVIGDVKASDEVLPRVTLTDVTNYVIDVGKISRDNLVTCNNCRAVFPAHCRPFKLRGLCPECYLPAVQDVGEPWADKPMKAADERSGAIGSG